MATEADFIAVLTSLENYISDCTTELNQQFSSQSCFLLCKDSGENSQRAPQVGSVL